MVYSAGPPVSSIATIPSERDAYANLLRDTRALRDEQWAARERWYASLPHENKEETLFELEVLLKGLVCFGNVRNHPGPPRGGADAADDLSEELRIVLDGLRRSEAVAGALLGEHEEADASTGEREARGLEDSARGRLSREPLTQDTPEASLLLLESTLGAFRDLAEGLLQGGPVGHRPYAALHGTVTREIERNLFFNPLMALEFCPELDRVRSEEVLEALRGVRSDRAHRIATLTALSVCRALAYLDLIERYAADASAGRRSYLILAVLRSDLGALTRYLRRNAGEVLAEGLESDLLAVHASTLHERGPALAQEARRLGELRRALESTAVALRVDLRRVFLRELPAPSLPTTGATLGPALRASVATLRASAQHALASLCGALSSGRPPRLAVDLAARRAAAERDRREIWMLLQIVRAFLAKGYAAQAIPDRWAERASMRFVLDFLVHFRAVGDPLVRRHEYERLEPLGACLQALRDVDLIAPERLGEALAECQRLQVFLKELFRELGARRELVGVAFDRWAAAETMKVYLGRPEGPAEARSSRSGSRPS